MLSSNALSMSEAAIAVSKLKKVLNLAELGNALAILAENGNNSIIEEPGFNAAIHWKEKTHVITRMRELLKNSGPKGKCTSCFKILLQERGPFVKPHSTYTDTAVVIM